MTAFGLSGRLCQPRPARPGGRISGGAAPEGGTRLWWSNLGVRVLAAGDERPRQGRRELVNLYPGAGPPRAASVLSETALQAGIQP